MKILSLNCQKAYNQNLAGFLSGILSAQKYDFLLLQEATPVVLSFLKHSSYETVTAYNDEASAQSHLCIVHRIEHKCTSSKLIPITNCDEPGALPKRPGYGALYGVFDIAGIQTRIGSLHLHSGISASIRRNGLSCITKELTKELHSTIIGGDCNFGPFEKRRAAQALAPDFMCLTRKIGTTLDSSYTEPHPFFLNEIANVLRAVGLNIKLPADNFFATPDIAGSSHTTRILPDRVSDHSPIELVLDK